MIGDRDRVGDLVAHVHRVAAAGNRQFKGEWGSAKRENGIAADHVPS